MKNLLIIAAVSGFLGVALGAFGAHALRDKLSESALNAYEKAVMHQFVHTLAILAVAGLVFLDPENKNLVRAGWSFSLGILFFSGSLYVYAMSGLKSFAMVTPVGGLAFLVGWALLLVGAMKFKSFHP